MPRNKKKRLSSFSAVKAVKANARERLGTPPPVHVIPDRASRRAHGPEKHKRTIEEVIAAASRD